MTGTVTITIVNDDTGHTEVRHLKSDEYAILYGPDLEVVDETVTLIGGGVTIRLRPKRR
jgi:hypothetical protein